MARQPGEDNGVSGLPEEWGRVVIPDDAAELAALAEEVRGELRYDDRLARRERRLPFIVLAVTVIVTLASLFSVPWLAGAGQLEPVPSPVASRTGPESDGPSPSTPRPSSSSPAAGSCESPGCDPRAERPRVTE
jgi:hypothetical protein